MQKASGDRIVQIRVDGFDKDDKALVPAQLEHIHELVEQVIQIGVSEEKVLNVLRRTLGVSSEEEILEKQYEEAVQCLNDQKAHAVSHNGLIHKILNLPDDLKIKARAYSNKHFQSSLYKSLTVLQLEQILDHVAPPQSSEVNALKQEIARLQKKFDEDLKSWEKHSYHMGFSGAFAGLAIGALVMYIFLR